MRRKGGWGSGVGIWDEMMLWGVFVGLGRVAWRGEGKGG